MTDVTTQGGEVYKEQEGAKQAGEPIQPVNGFILVEPVKEKAVFKSYDSYSPHPMEVLAVSRDWFENGQTLVCSAKVGDIVLPSRIYPYNINNQELVFVKDSDVVAILKKGSNR